MMGHGLFNLVDLVIVGRLETGGAIAAVTIAGILLTIAMLFFDGVATTTVALVAFAQGSRRPERAVKVAGESFLLAVLAGVVGGLGFWLGAAPSVDGFGLSDQATRADAIGYFQVSALGLITMFLIMQTTAVLRGVGDTAWPVGILVGANALNILLDIALVFGVWGFPEMGVEGAAWATVIARGVGCLFGVGRLLVGSRGLRMTLASLRPPFEYLRPLLVMGLPTSLQLSVRVLVVLGVLRIALGAYEGSAEALLDGVGICIRLEMVAVFLGLGWGAAATTVVGQNLGAGFPRRAALGTWFLAIYAAVTMSAAGLLLVFLRDWLLLSIEPQLGPAGLAEATTYLLLTIPAYPFLGASLVIARALNGATSTKSPLAIDASIGVLVTLPVAWWWTRVWGAPGAWAAAAATHVLSVAVYGLVFLNGHWKRKKLKGMSAAEPPAVADPPTGRGPPSDSLSPVEGQGSPTR